MDNKNTGREKGGRSKLILLITFVSFAVIIILSIFARNTFLEGSRFKAIVIANTDTGEIYARGSIEDGGEFDIEFVHSVNKSPVRETFKVEGKLIRPVAVRFFSFGAGMLSDLEEGMSMTRDGDAMIITGFTRAYSELNYIVGTVSDHLLMIKGQTFSMTELCGRNAHVTIKVRN